MKKRLDIVLCEQNENLSREKARALIMSGVVFVNNQKADKAGLMISEEEKVELRGDKLKYVSRGGLKLEKALSVFPIDLTNKIALDAGASTGGFTDCMLQNGAKKVYAVDVGYGQLAWELRCDPRVMNMERKNVRLLLPSDLEELCDFATADLAFISLKLVLKPIYTILTENGEAVCLIKPQFEAGREKVGKHGVVRDISVHLEVVEEITEFAKSIGFAIAGLSFSPIKGPKGNIEYLLYLKKGGESTTPDYAEIVRMSHELLKGGDE